ncbi:peroxiredoxin family protein [Echinicola soli]
MMANREGIQHRSTYHWENALNEMDTFQYDIQLVRHQNDYFDFNYITQGANSDVVYINNDLKIINHSDSTVENFLPNQLEDNKDRICKTMALAFNPVLLLQQKEWSYAKDTIVKGTIFHDFYLVQMDTTIGEKEIYLERHLFINPATKTPGFFSNRLYHNGSRSQVIHAYFSGYDFQAPNEALAYLPPSNYVSKSSQDKKTEKRIMLKAGDVAPDFELPTLDGQTIKLSDMKGQKVLLDFSMINCGWCGIALDNFNKPGFTFKSNIKPIYLNPVDTKEDMKKYAAIKNIDFPVVPEAKAVGKAYGVSGYPSFFLIDEKGIIEKAFAGFDKETILEFSH